MEVGQQQIMLLGSDVLGINISKAMTLEVSGQFSSSSPFRPQIICKVVLLMMEMMMMMIIIKVVIMMMMQEVVVVIRRI